jgi:hypothetical protein
MSYRDKTRGKSAPLSSPYQSPGHASVEKLTDTFPGRSGAHSGLEFERTLMNISSRVTRRMTW